MIFRDYISWRYKAKKRMPFTSNASQIRKEKDLRNELTPLISLEEHNKLAFDRDHKSPIVEIALLERRVQTRSLYSALFH